MKVLGKKEKITEKEKRKFFHFELINLETIVTRFVERTSLNS